MSDADENKCTYSYSCAYDFPESVKRKSKISVKANNTF